MPKLGENKKSALEVLCSQVTYELKHRRQLQARPALTHTLSVTETPGILGVGQERDGYLSDPGSCGSQDQAPAPQIIEQQSLSMLESRIENLEEHYQQKIDALESRCATLENKVQTLESANKDLEDELSNITDAINKEFKDIDEDIYKDRHKFNTHMDEIKDRFIGVETALQNMESAAAPQTSNLGEETTLNSRVHELERQLESLNETIIEMNTKISRSDERSGSDPLSRWQSWKKRACEIVGSLNPNQKSRNLFHCYDETCHWKNKNVSLNAYIQHVKRKDHLVDLKNKPDEKYLPRV